jgi:hypothetical protein
MVERGIAIEFQPWRPIFEKCPNLREKEGVLTLKTPYGVCASKRHASTTGNHGGAWRMPVIFVWNIMWSCM